MNRPLRTLALTGLLVAAIPVACTAQAPDETRRAQGSEKPIAPPTSTGNWQVWTQVKP